MASYIVLLGPPGVGKGTQAKIVAQKTGKPHVSSGDLFRENIKNGTDLGRLAQSYIQKGELVPDDVTIAMIRDRITSGSDCNNGAILDGFPRTPAQAIALEKLLEEFGGNVDIVPYITAPEKTLVARLSGRWTCPQCGHIFNTTFNPPKRSGICDYDGSELYQRDDDKAETVTRRIQVYFEQTAPLISYYREAGKLTEINGAQSIDEVTNTLLEALNKAADK
jgi:adenylate kinase